MLKLLCYHHSRGDKKMTSTTQERYHRQLILQGFGPDAQDALTKAKVLVIGAGGLGCPVLQYLVAAGVGTIGIVENDKVSLSNLHRQVLYDTTDVGRLKIEVAAEKLRFINPDVRIVCYPIYLDKTNSLAVIMEYDVIVDCTDNFSTRYMVNDACIITKKPLVYGAVSEFEGQVAVFNVEGEESKRSANAEGGFVHPGGRQGKNLAPGLGDPDHVLELRR